MNEVLASGYQGKGIGCKTPKAWPCGLGQRDGTVVVAASVSPCGRHGPLWSYIILVRRALGPGWPRLLRPGSGHPSLPAALLGTTALLL